MVEPKTHAVTCSSITGDRWLKFSYRNLGKFRASTAETVSCIKKLIRGGHSVGPSSNRWKTYRGQKM